MEASLDIQEYHKVFAERMKMAGIKPHQRIAIAVSGGADSMSLCILAAYWKRWELGKLAKNGKFIPGLVSFVVDHGLRAESSREAQWVQDQVSSLGIQCDVLRCVWPNGPPKQGHLQEAARNYRYRLLMDKCKECGIGVLLVAHHGDDQAELLLLRLSRNSGFTGLAGMAFVSQLFHGPTVDFDSSSDQVHKSMLLVRPLLCFYKDDLYKICEIAGQRWVEDPSNHNIAFARNRIRKSLANISSCDFKKEIQDFMYGCRKLRKFVDDACNDLIKETVTVHADYGYVIVNVQKLLARSKNTLCLSRLLGLLLQFISQKDKPIRGNAIQILIEYLQNFPCKGSLTVGGCNVSPVSGSKGSKVLICFSSESPQASSSQILSSMSCRGCDQTITEVEDIINSSKRFSNEFWNVDFEAPLWNLGHSDKILVQAMKEGIISESTMSRLVLLKDELAREFYEKNTVKNGCKQKSQSYKELDKDGPLSFDQSCYYMNRFVVSWEQQKFRKGLELRDIDTNSDVSFPNIHNGMDLGMQCSSCPVKSKFAWIRHMKESDWNYISHFLNDRLSGTYASKNHIERDAHVASKLNIDDLESFCADHRTSKGRDAFTILKTIPLPVRKSLPVLVNGEGTLLGIPGIAFMCCPLISALSVFRPRIPLGGGYTSWL